MLKLSGNHARTTTRPSHQGKERTGQTPAQNSLPQVQNSLPQAFAPGWAARSRVCPLEVLTPPAGACFPGGGERRAGGRGAKPPEFQDGTPVGTEEACRQLSLLLLSTQHRLLKSNLPGLPGHSERQINHRSEVGGLYTLYEQP